MIDHTGIGVANVARTEAFCDAALGALGLHRVTQLQVNDRADGHPADYYAAFVLDPDGNNMEAVSREAWTQRLHSCSPDSDAASLHVEPAFFGPQRD